MCTYCVPVAPFEALPLCLTKKEEHTCRFEILLLTAVKGPWVTLKEWS